MKGLAMGEAARYRKHPIHFNEPYGTLWASLLTVKLRLLWVKIFLGSPDEKGRNRRSYVTVGSHPARVMSGAFTGFEVVLLQWRSIVAGLGSNIEPKSCDGALTPTEIQALEEATEVLLYTCAVCGKRNLYAIKTPRANGNQNPTVCRCLDRKRIERA
jgi:hypothetical protein